MPTKHGFTLLRKSLLTLIFSQSLNFQILDLVLQFILAKPPEERQTKTFKFSK